jgi:hypothetical protein
MEVIICSNLIYKNVVSILHMKNIYFLNIKNKVGKDTCFSRAKQTHNVFIDCHDVSSFESWALLNDRNLIARMFDPI